MEHMEAEDWFRLPAYPLPAVDDEAVSIVFLTRRTTRLALRLSDGAMVRLLRRNPFDGCFRIGELAAESRLEFVDSQLHRKVE